MPKLCNNPVAELPQAAAAVLWQRDSTNPGNSLDSLINIYAVRVNFIFRNILVKRPDTSVNLLGPPRGRPLKPGGKTL